MKLRNKKTGKVQTCDFMVISDDRSRDGEIARLNSHVFIFRSIEQLNEEYEDYKPTEPIIKDEKIRKAVRAWWKTIPDAITDKRILYKKNQDLAVGVYSIYCGAIYPETLEAGKMYTIDELCGEATDEA